MYISSKSVVIGLGWIFVVVAIVLTYGLSSQYYEDKRKAEEVGTTPVTLTDSSRSADFIGVCSGMDISNPEVQLMAMSECMGRVRGFVDGHHTTIAMNSIAGTKSISLWCMPNKVSTGQLLTEVMDWADTHPKEYVRIRSSMDDDNGAMAIMIKALRVTYPCANS